jgi:TRAP-type C4-dicarboxylate transport system permease small subunit
MKAFNQIWTKVELAFVGIMALAGAFVGFYGILMRYVFVKPVGWVEEVLTYLLVWALLVIISPVQQDNGHIRVESLIDRVSPAWRKVLELLSIIVSFAFCLVMIYYGWNIVEFLLLLDQMSESSLQFPMWLVRLSIPVGFILMAARLVQSGVRLFVKEPDKNNDSCGGMAP